MDQKESNKFNGITETLEKLVSVRSHSGKEHELFELFKAIATNHGLKTWTDGRNAYATIGKLKKDKPTILISGHGDEVGMLVSGFTDSGMIRISEWNGFSKVLPGLEVVVKGKKDINGVIGCKPPHLMKPGEMDKIIPIDQLYVDTGLSRSELIDNVSIGDSVHYKKQFHKLKNDRIASCAVDDKIAVTILLELGKRLAKTNLDVNLVLACTGSEEIGSQGASFAFREIKPDIAICVDTMHATQSNTPAGDDADLSAGIYIGNGALINKTIAKALFDASSKLCLQSNALVFEGSPRTDTDRFIHTDLGCPSGIMIIPIRYLHQPIEVFDLNTAHDCIMILDEFIREIPGNLEGVL
jgi:tetrahedral aminopeptidase